MGHLIRLEDIDEIHTSEGRWQPLNKRSGITQFGLNAVSMEPGEAFDIAHDETDSLHQEAYIVVRGRAGFRIGGEEIVAAPGDVVVVADPAERRDYWALEPGTRIVCVGAGPGAEHPYGDWIRQSPDGK